MFSKDKVTEIFFYVDEFCKEFSSEVSKIKRIDLSDGKKTRERSLSMSDSEIITILICFHLGSHRTFKQYYNQLVKGYWSDLFPNTLSYNRLLRFRHDSFCPWLYLLNRSVWVNVLE